MIGPFAALRASALVVVADAHFGGAAHPAGSEDRFLAFLDAVPSLGDSLLLAGDIFDFWFTYRHVIPRRSIRITAAIIELARRMPVLMLGGNHDRWGDTFWSAEAGIQFSERELRFEIGERSVLAIHGDGLHHDTARTSMLNRIINSRAAIRGFHFLPQAIGFWIADSLAHDPDSPRGRPEILAAGAARQETWAAKLMAREPGVDALIMAHTHLAVAREIEPGRWYLNPGPWIGSQSYGILDEHGAQLLTFT